MKNDTIYLAGPVTNYDLAERRRYFGKIADQIKPFVSDVKNPMRFGIPADATHEKAMKVFCLPIICECDSILLLPNWQASRGAKFEYEVAREIGLRIYVLNATGSVFDRKSKGIRFFIEMPSEGRLVRKNYPG